MEMKNEIEVSIPEDVDNIVNHMPKLEFWTCIYRKSFLDRNSIRFYEYKVQDIETSFRYMAFSNATKIEVNKEWFFYLQRDNLQSNTHTWNKYNLYVTKSRVFYDLLSKCKYSDDRDYLSNLVKNNNGNFNSTLIS